VLDAYLDRNLALEIQSRVEKELRRNRGIATGRSCRACHVALAPEARLNQRDDAREG
jgi:hypothetical protein